MKTPAIIRILVIAALALFLIEMVSLTSDTWAVIENPTLLLVWIGIIIFMIAIEVSVMALQRILFHTLPQEAQEKYLVDEALRKGKRFEWINAFYLKLVGEKAAATEEEIILDHNYDGIRELDNNLPPWWVYGFYATIVFALVYMLYYHVFDGPTQIDEYQSEVAAAQKAVEEYKKNAKDLVDASTVEMLTSEHDLEAGANVFSNNCAVCHRADGAGGIGPNLTDNYWILGGGISDIFEVISEGGRPGKGMISWKSDLRPVEIAQVASYIKTLQGTNPPDAKAAEGDLYESEELPESDSGEELDQEPETPETEESPSADQ